MAENVVGGQREELLALHHALLVERGADRIDHHRVRDVAVEGVAVAALAAQRVGAGAGREEHFLVALGDLHDGQRRGRGDFAEQHHGAILLDHALGLGRGGRGIDRVFRHQVDLLAHDAAGRVDLFGGELHAELGIAADRAEKAGQRRQMSDFDFGGLGADDRRKSQGGSAGKRGAGLQQSTSAVADHGWSPPRGRITTSCLRFPLCENVRDVLLLLEDNSGRSRTCQRQMRRRFASRRFREAFRRISPRCGRRTRRTAAGRRFAPAWRGFSAPGRTSARSGRKCRARRSRRR